MDERRIRRLNTKKLRKEGPIAYWMSRDQRTGDNWALLFAQDLAAKYERSLLVLFCLVPEFLGATIRQYKFMLRGLKEVESRLQTKNISFLLLKGNPECEIPRFIEKNQVSTLVSDFDPLKLKRKWKSQVNKKIEVPFYEVDAHNVVPCWIASPKQEFAAHTMRGKIKKILAEFLTEFPKLNKQKTRQELKNNDWETIEKSLRIDHSVSEVSWIQPGEKEAFKRMEDFIENRLRKYSDMRNNPTKDGLSDLSPFLHFGQIAAQRIALEVEKSGIKEKVAFLEELIVRRELADNYCFYNHRYDSFGGFPEWAKKTLDSHRKDSKEYIYTQQQFEEGKTHDDLWNAAQIEMVKKGKMHGYMRMYWAKKILEWSKSPEKALNIAIDLNDKYELDGRDPNGYTGIAWSIGGVHDRPWLERKVFGKIRYMSYNGCKSKFDVKKYIDRINAIA